MFSDLCFYFTRRHFINSKNSIIRYRLSITLMSYWFLLVLVPAGPWSPVDFTEITRIPRGVVRCVTRFCRVKDCVPGGDDVCRRRSFGSMKCCFSVTSKGSPRGHSWSRLAPRPVDSVLIKRTGGHFGPSVPDDLQLTSPRSVLGC